MKLLLISTSFNGLSQRFYSELKDAGYEVAVELHHGDREQVIRQTELFDPDLIICPYLTRRIPDEVWKKYLTLIVHPGIKGDRGPSSLDWAIQDDFDEWGVTILQADSEMDAGDIWSSKTFPMRSAPKSSLYNREVTSTAVNCLWEVLAFIESKHYKPEPLDYSNPKIKGRLRPLIKQHDRAINWTTDNTDKIIRHINAADGNPGVADEIYGKRVSLFNVKKETALTGKPGEVIARSPNGAICRATVDGAVWIGHLRKRNDDASLGIKLPSTEVLCDVLPGTVTSVEFNYSQPGKTYSCQETWYELDDDIAYVYGAFHNGAMSTSQCHDFLTVYKTAASLPVRAVILCGNEDVWNNGIHLNHIEYADNPSDESWLNINAINDVVYQIITTMDKITVSAVTGNAGAGGAILALAADFVYARKGVIFNPHYKNMGSLYGSEYWTYLLPGRVGLQVAHQITNECLPISCHKAWKLGLVDKVLDENHQLFHAQVRHLIKSTLDDHNSYATLLKHKATKRCRDEAIQALSVYRRHELTQMHHNFYADDKYHEARRRFVHKIPCGKTPKNISIQTLLPRPEKNIASEV